MKRVKAACIYQTLIFTQKEDTGFDKAYLKQLNREEFEKYKASLDKSRTRYQIVDEQEQADGSLLVHVRKQYNDKADVTEYFA